MEMTGGVTVDSNWRASVGVNFFNLNYYDSGVVPLLMQPPRLQRSFASPAARLGRSYWENCQYEARGRASYAR
eukprot:scaffold29982_cov37-Prasinocladus_malaysianus.AAC.1